MLYFKDYDDYDLLWLLSHTKSRLNAMKNSKRVYLTFLDQYDYDRDRAAEIELEDRIAAIEKELKRRKAA